MDCLICYLPFDLKENLPLVLNCGHTFCKMCLDNFTQKCIELKIDFSCPFCKKLFKISNHQNFVKNYSLILLLEQKNVQENSSVLVKKKQNYLFNMLSLMKKQQNSEILVKNEQIFSCDNEFYDHQGNQNKLYCEYDISQFNRVLKVEISVNTKDQGWASSNCSGSWVTFQLIGNNNEVLQDQIIWTNLRVKNYELRKLVYDKKKEQDQKIIDDFNSAQRIIIYANSKYPGWKCHIKNSQIKIISKIKKQIIKQKSLQNLKTIEI